VGNDSVTDICEEMSISYPALSISYHFKGKPPVKTQEKGEALASPFD
jgi:hypothetical protein